MSGTSQSNPGIQVQANKVLAHLREKFARQPPPNPAWFLTRPSDPATSLNGSDHTLQDWDGHLLEENDGDYLETEVDLSAILAPAWTMNLPERFENLAKARKALHQAFSTYLYIIHGQILSDDPTLPARSLWNRQLLEPGTPVFPQIIVDTDARIGSLYAADWLWEEKLEAALADYEGSLDEETWRLESLVAEAMGVTANMRFPPRLPDRIEDAPLTDQGNKKWIKTFSWVAGELQDVMRGLYEKVSRVPREDCEVVLHRRSEVHTID